MDDLRQAYLTTDYWVETPEEWIRIRVGETSEPLDRLLATHGATSWAFVSTDNPGSVRSPPRENDIRRMELESHVACPLLPGLGIGRVGDWPPERSHLLVGIGRDEAVRLAKRLGQNAILFGTRGGAAELVDCT